MGNETSSVKIHSLLSAEDIKKLRAGFPVSFDGRMILASTQLNSADNLILTEADGMF